MKRTIALAALIGATFVAASASSALAQSSAPGTTPSKPNKVVVVPPPPPPGGPDKLTSQTGPLRPGARPTVPKPYDEFAAKPNVQKYPPLFEPCNSSDCNIESYLTDCQAAHGGASTEPGGAIVCNQGPQHQPKP